VLCVSALLMRGSQLRDVWAAACVAVPPTCCTLRACYLLLACLAVQPVHCIFHCAGCGALDGCHQHQHRSAPAGKGGAAASRGRARWVLPVSLDCCGWPCSTAVGGASLLFPSPRQNIPLSTSACCRADQIDCEESALPAADEARGGAGNQQQAPGAGQHHVGPGR
jgi:hypothetical protein